MQNKKTMKLSNLNGMDDWYELDEKFVWHPFTQAFTEKNPIPIESAEGVWLKDKNGKRYLDANSSWWVNVHGHSNQTINARIKKQIDQLQHVIFAGVAHEPASRLCEELKPWLPEHFEKFFFSDNGSTANEVAIKMCHQYFFNQNLAKDTIIAMEGSYHGDTFGAMSVSERDIFNRPFEAFMFDVKYIPFPDGTNDEEVINCIDQIIQSNQVAAFIFEPLVQGAAGMRMYSAKTLDRLIEKCAKNNVLTIADEVMTGFGRTGKMFATNYLENKPDIMCLSKGLTGGYLPMGLTVTHDAIYQVFLSEQKQNGFLHGHSFTGNPLACEAARASLDLFDDATFEAISRIHEKHQEFLNSFNAEYSDNTRLIGTILAIDIETEDQQGYFNPAASKVYHFFKEKGLLVRPLGNTVFINPPYCIKEEELDLIYQSIYDLKDWLSR